METNVLRMLVKVKEKVQRRFLSPRRRTSVSRLTPKWLSAAGRGLVSVAAAAAAATSTLFFDCCIANQSNPKR